MKHQHIAIIPARGGSKGIPKKNIKLFNGLPLIYWSILQAQLTPEIGAVYVSSDSDEILSIAHSFKAIPIKRPENLSGDSATTESALVHLLDTLTFIPETITLLQATSPLRFPTDISNALQLMQKQGWNSLFSGARMDDFLMWRHTNDRLVPLNYDYQNRGKRQDRFPEYCENGSIYIVKPDTLLRYNNRIGDPFGIYCQTFWQCFELDSPEEWPFLELLFRYYLEDQYKENQL
jgi:CMP-N,N'-diacetyllegionaminic acid synthase